MTDIFDYLRARPYPGRGILLGAAPDGAPVCAYFSHHLGMSIVALANAAFGDVFVRRFMSDVRMRAGLELLEERSPTELPLRGEPPL